MRKFVLTATMILLSAYSAFGQEVTMQELLREMVDRDKLTDFPSYKTLQASSYNRASVSPNEPGWFADADGVSCIRTELNKNGETEWVLMEDKGPGAIVKIWAVCFYYSMSDLTGANVKIYLDGEEDPTIFCNFFDFVQGKSFVKPPFASETRRAGNSYLPIPYSKSCKVTMDKKVFYNIINYRHYPEGTKVRTFTMSEYENSKSLLDSVGYLLSGGCCFESGKSVKKTEVLLPGDSVAVSVGNGHKSGAVRCLSLRVLADNQAQALRSTVLKASFDGEQTIWSPVGDFFNIGAGMKQYKMWERAVEDDGTMICRWVMPYRKQSSWTLVNLGNDTVTVEMNLETGPYKWSESSMYFHSNWRMDDPTPGFPLFDFNMVKVIGSGVYVGDQMTVLNPVEGWWGEGDEKVYVDDDTFPSHFGTGTEDYFGWAGGVVPNPVDEFSRPFLANVKVGSPNSIGYNTCTRTRALDAIPFRDSIDFYIEASGSRRNSWFHMVYAVNTFWYAKPAAVSNRIPLPDMASRKLMTIQELQHYNEECKQNVYLFQGAIEAETLDTYILGNGVQETGAVSIWGDLSAGASKYFSFDAKGNMLEFRLTELFDNVPLKICLATCPKGGEYEIFVNGICVRTVNLLSEHSALTTLDLGKFSPKDNSLIVKFVCTKPGTLVLDYFLTE